MPKASRSIFSQSSPSERYCIIQINCSRSSLPSSPPTHSNQPTDMPASGLKTSKRSKQTPKSSILKTPTKPAAAPSKPSPKATAKALKASAPGKAPAPSGDQFFLNSDHVTVDASLPAVSAAPSRKSRKAAGAPRAVVYIGRLPHGFFEDQLKVRRPSTGARALSLLPPHSPTPFISLACLLPFLPSSPAPLACACCSHSIDRHFWVNLARLLT
jgi:hypothetical protein